MLDDLRSCQPRACGQCRHRIVPETVAVPDQLERCDTRDRADDDTDELRDQLLGRRVACIMSGGNLDRARLKRILAG